MRRSNTTDWLLAAMVACLTASWACLCASQAVAR
jgi:hypothetical protein